ncbi:MAG: hypothetical protein QM487_09770 [Candidatus Marithrix sp.]
MRIVFDNTLIREKYPFPLDSQYWFLEWLGFEPLRKNTIQLMKLLQKQHKIWIYTSSMRGLIL